MKKATFTLLSIVCFTLLTKCKKSDSEIDEAEKIEIINGGEAFTSQSVKIKIDNFSLQEKHKIVFDGIDLIAAKTANNELIFHVPSDMDLGEKLLIIPEFNNYTISYTVKKTELPDNPNAIMAPFFEDYKSAISIFSDQEDVKFLNSYIQNLEDYYNSKNAEEKQVMAEYYHINKTFFKNALSNSLNAKDKNSELLEDFGVSVIILGSSVAIAVVNPEPISRGIAIGVAVLSFKSAYKNYVAFSNNNIKILDFVIDDIVSEFDKKANSLKEDSFIEFNDKIEKTVSFKNNTRSLIADDELNKTGKLEEFFSSFNTMNSLITSINDAITFVNEKLFFSNLSLINLATLPLEVPSTLKGFTPELFENITFSIADSNIMLSKASLGKNNELVLKLEIEDITKVTEQYIETTLNFTLFNDFNNLQGAFPIKLFAKHILEGEWEAISIDGNTMGTFVEYPFGDPCTEIPRGAWSYDKITYTIVKGGPDADLKIIEDTEISNKDYNIDFIGPDQCNYDIDKDVVAERNPQYQSGTPTDIRSLVKLNATDFTAQRCHGITCRPITFKLTNNNNTLTIETKGGNDMSNTIVFERQ